MLCNTTQRGTRQRHEEKDTAEFFSSSTTAQTAHAIAQITQHSYSRVRAQKTSYALPGTHANARLMIESVPSYRHTAAFMISSLTQRTTQSAYHRTQQHNNTRTLTENSSPHNDSEHRQQSSSPAQFKETLHQHCRAYPHSNSPARHGKT